LGWHRDLVAKRWTYSHGRPGRLAIAKGTTALVLRLSKENPTWGYRRTHGELATTGVTIAAPSVWAILKHRGVDPSPRRSGPTWAEFLSEQAKGLMACDSFHVDTVLLRRLYVLVFIHHDTRFVRIAGVTANPVTGGVTQQARNLSMALADQANSVKFRIRDRDTMFTASLGPHRRTCPRSAGGWHACRARSGRRSIDLQWGMPSQHVEVAVGVQQRASGSNGDAGDEAVDHLANGLPISPTHSIQRCRLFVVGGLRGDEGASGEQAPQIVQVTLVPCPGEHLHPDGLADDEALGQEVVNAPTDGAGRVSEKLHPAQGVNQDHWTRSERKPSRSPSQPEPRSARARSRSRGSAATVRSAKFTASRLVARW
jgi:hypothetical protein